MQCIVKMQEEESTTGRNQFTVRAKAGRRSQRGQHVPPERSAEEHVQFGKFYSSSLSPSVYAYNSDTFGTAWIRECYRNDSSFTLFAPELPLHCAKEKVDKALAAFTELV